MCRKQKRELLSFETGVTGRKKKSENTSNLMSLEHNKRREDLYFLEKLKF